MFSFRNAAVLVVAVSLSGCASMFGGTSQEIEVVTSPPEADCKIFREDKIIGRIRPTPGTIMVKKSRKDITVSCVKLGHFETSAVSDSGVEGWVFANILLGGLIGLGIDHATGGVNKYESPVNITMTPADFEENPLEFEEQKQIPTEDEKNQEPSKLPTS